MRVAGLAGKNCVMPVIGKVRCEEIYVPVSLSIYPSIYLSLSISTFLFTACIHLSIFIHQVFLTFHLPISSFIHLSILNDILLYFTFSQLHSTVYSSFQSHYKLSKNYINPFSSLPFYLTPFHLNPHHPVPYILQSIHHQHQN